MERRRSRNLARQDVQMREHERGALCEGRWFVREDAWDREGGRGEEDPVEEWEEGWDEWSVRGW